jgi:hypothetical protein
MVQFRRNGLASLSPSRLGFNLLQHSCESPPYNLTVCQSLLKSPFPLLPNVPNIKCIIDTPAESVERIHGWVYLTAATMRINCMIIWCLPVRIYKNTCFKTNQWLLFRSKFTSLHCKYLPRRSSGFENRFPCLFTRPQSYLSIGHSTGRETKLHRREQRHQQRHNLPR